MTKQEGRNMIRVLPRSERNVIGIEFSGKITREDYTQVLIPTFNSIIAEHGKIRALIDFANDFSGYEWRAIIKDAVFGVKHLRHFEKIAMINAPSWISIFIKIIDKLTKCRSRAFDSSNRETAWDFIEN
jgi:hypothetical protein